MKKKKTKSIMGALSLRSKIKAPPTQVHANKKRKAINDRKNGKIYTKNEYE